MDIAVQRGVAYVDTLSCKQSYLSVLRHAEVIFQAKQAGKQFRREDTSKIFQGMLHRGKRPVKCV